VALIEEVFFPGEDLVLVGFEVEVDDEEVLDREGRCSSNFMIFFVIGCL